MDDFIIDVSVESLWYPENRQQSDVLVKKMRFRVNGAYISADYLKWPIPPIAPDFEPVHPKPLAGLAVNLQDLKIPVPERSRLRLSLVMPVYPNPLASGWGLTPWIQHVVTAGLTCMEQLVE